ncbi:MAG: hypothetical protein IIY78_03595 [Clostridia bacterium]|nr:hypothetical protein [Clostridia bacterium]
MAKKSITPTMLFLLGVFSIMGLLSEYLLIELETYIFNKKYIEFTITESVTHWIVICVVWALLGLLLFYVTARVYGFDMMKKNERPTMQGLVVAVMLLSSSVGVKYILLGGWQMAVDFRREGWFQFIFLYIYRLFETVLLLMAAAFFQEGFERVVKIDNKKIPWGGAILALTWGLIHLITTGDVIMALFYTALSFFIGCAYLSAHRNVYISYIFAVVLMLL